MSKKSKANAKQVRLNKKRAIKMANKAKYQTWADSGENNKSFRNRSNKKKKKLAKPFSHSEGSCGNLACICCYPINTR